MKQSEKRTVHGIVIFLVVLFLDIGNIFTRIINSIGWLEAITIAVAITVVIGGYFRLDTLVKMPIDSEVDMWVADGKMAGVIYFCFEVIAGILHQRIFAPYKSI